MCTFRRQQVSRVRFCRVLVTPLHLRDGMVGEDETERRAPPRVQRPDLLLPFPRSPSVLASPEPGGLPETMRHDASSPEGPPAWPGRGRHASIKTWRSGFHDAPDALSSQSPTGRPLAVKSPQGRNVDDGAGWKRERLHGRTRPCAVPRTATNQCAGAATRVWVVGQTWSSAAPPGGQHARVGYERLCGTARFA